MRRAGLRVFFTIAALASCGACLSSTRTPAPSSVVAVRNAPEAGTERALPDRFDLESYDEPIAPPEAIGGGPKEDSPEEPVERQPAPSDPEKVVREALEKIAILGVGTVRLDDRGTIICLPVGTLFDGDAIHLSPAATEPLALVSQALDGADGHSIVVEGYTDSQGNSAANRRLSQQRADAVRAHLVDRGVSEDRIVAQGFGSARPIADNETVRGRSRNQRIEIVVQPIVEE